MGSSFPLSLESQILLTWFCYPQLYHDPMSGCYKQQLKQRLSLFTASHRESRSYLSQNIAEASLHLLLSQTSLDCSSLKYWLIQRVSWLCLVETDFMGWNICCEWIQYPLHPILDQQKFQEERRKKKKDVLSNIRTFPRTWKHVPRQKGIIEKPAK